MTRKTLLDVSCKRFTEEDLNTAVMPDTMNTTVLIQICLFYGAKLAHANPSQT